MSTIIFNPASMKASGSTTLSVGHITKSRKKNLKRVDRRRLMWLYQASSTSKYSRISLLPDAHSPTQQTVTQPPIFLSIGGRLPGGRWLSSPITVKIEEDDGEFVVSELKYYMHGEGSTISEAIEAFKRIFSGYLNVLSEEENNLSSYMHEQLEYLRSVITTE